MTVVIIRASTAWLCEHCSSALQLPEQVAMLHAQQAFEPVCMYNAHACDGCCIPVVVQREPDCSVASIQIIGVESILHIGMITKQPEGDNVQQAPKLQ